MKRLHVFIWTLILLALTLQVTSQTCSIKLEISNQPQSIIVLGTISGDNFTAIDSTKGNTGIIKFSLNESNHAGIYRVILGYTPYARLMKEAPQSFDFIFNRENVSIVTDFKHPFDSLKVLSSDENKLWYEVLRNKHEYQKQYELLDKEVNHYWSRKDTLVAFEKSNEFNQLQMGHDIYLGQKTQQNTDLYVSKIISIYREPVLDGYLNAEEKSELYHKDFFKTVDFSHPELINSSVYTDKVFDFLISYNKPSFSKTKREEAYTEAVNIILSQANKNEKVYQFMKAYLIHGFEVLQMQKVSLYIQQNY